MRRCIGAVERGTEPMTSKLDLAEKHLAELERLAEEAAELFDGRSENG